MTISIKDNNDAKDVFKQCGTCSRTFAHILNREFGHIKENEERALNPLAGGILNEGHQCGMLWGAALAVGAESYRKHNNQDKAITIAVTATQKIMDSFVKQSGATDCKDIIGYDLTSIIGMSKFMLKVTLQGMKNSHCFNLAEQWAPEAVEVATQSLSEYTNISQKPLSCASEVVKQMGGSIEEVVMVAGYAGGLGLSGNACGALSAAIWKRMLDWCREHPDKNPPFFNNKTAKKLLKAFNKSTDDKMLCSDICGQEFQSLEDHTAYLKNGGCQTLIAVLANS
ncbi:C-GCAxxG-C-C family protein [uncultured Winogradskyella sp.]|uniref:C-GCAxxG-C-C family protein n=1 Tax=uncultured Winogradskyella sp. TaxID=395353 RepID=UPI002608672A|nr:C-GCAxxG-C-C family protein [uncultured Winogradskyella sp.]